jgi:hypothetical protein
LRRYNRAMTASPVVRTDTIVVVPASLAATGDAVLGLASEVRGHARRPLSADAIGSAHCSEALAGAARLIDQALRASAQSLEEIARALRAASGAYGLADVVAFRQESR